MSSVAVITEACLDSNEQACVDVCPVHCIYRLASVHGNLFSEVAAGSGEVAHRHQADPDAAGLFGSAILYVNADECTGCGACCHLDVCPSGAIYLEDRLPDGRPGARYNPRDRYKGHDHTYFAVLSRTIFADGASDGS